MKRRQIVVASLLTVIGLVAVVAFAALSSTGDDAMSGGGNAGAAGTPTPLPSPTVGATAPPPNVGGFIRKVDRLCDGLGRLQAVPDNEALDLRAARMRAELEVLQPLLAALRELRIPKELREPMRDYRRRLLGQIRLDRLVLAAAEKGDTSTVQRGMGQNEFNRSERTKLAHDMGFSSCLADPGRA
jgi:hypothetical protein